MARIFENPANGYQESVNFATSALGAALFGPVYFALKGAWSWAIVEFIWSFALIAMWPPLTLIVIPIQLLVGLLAPGILAKRYLQRGWKEIKETETGRANPTTSESIAKACPQCMRAVDTNAQDCGFCGHRFG